MTEGRLIAFAGAAGSGKSLATEHLVARGFRVVKFAGPLKAMLTALYEETGAEPWEIEERIEGKHKETACEVLQGHTPRHAMQTLGTEWGRNYIDPNFWVDLWAYRASRLLAAGWDVVTDDLRFANEALAVESLGGTTILIERPNPSRAASDHVSEAFGFETHEVILNDGTATDLEWAVDNILDGGPL